MSETGGVVPFSALYPQSPVHVDGIAYTVVKKGPPPSPGAATGSDALEGFCYAPPWGAHVTVFCAVRAPCDALAQAHSAKNESLEG